MSKRTIRDRVLPAAGLLAILAGSGYLAWAGWARPEPTYRLRITGGKSPGPKQRMAEILATQAGRKGLIVEVRESPGSVESLEAVNEGRVDLAVVQGGIDSGRWPEVRQVAALQVEPLQLAVRGDLAPEVEANLDALKGRSINVGEVGSGSEALAREVLEFVGLRAGDYRARNLGHQGLMEIRDREQLPDAVLTVGSPPTPAIRELVRHRGYRLVPLPFVEAFALADLAEGGAGAGARAGSRSIVDKAHLQPATIPAFTYGFDPPVPPAPLATFGARVLVVAHRRTPDDAVDRVLETIFRTDFAEVARPPLDPSSLDNAPEFPPHPGTVEFVRRNKPLVVGDAFDFADNALSVVGAVLGGSFVIWQWARRSYRRRRELGFEAYLLKVTGIESEALRLELAPELDLAALLTLQSDLGRIKAEALRRFTKGELEGEGLMSGFLAHANDARDYLARLILHARTTIEKRARKQGLTAGAAWELAIGAHDEPGPRGENDRDGEDHGLADREGVF